MRFNKVWSLVRSLRLVSAPGAPISPLAFQVTIESLETPRGKRLQEFPVGSDGGFGLLGSGGFALFQFFGELLEGVFRWDAESFGSDWLPDWLGELCVEPEAYDGLPGRCDGAFIEVFVGFDGDVFMCSSFVEGTDVLYIDFRF